MKIMVLDDERPAVKRMLDTLRRLCPDSETIGLSTYSEYKNYEDKKSIDIAFVDIELGNALGIDVAIDLKNYSPRCNIIFVSSHSEYGTASFTARPSGYVMKPYSDEDIIKELENLRYPISDGNKLSEESSTPEISSSEYEVEDEEMLKCTTFGNFTVYKKNGGVMKFSRTKSKELLAYLIDCAGFPVTSTDVARVIFETELDKQMSKNISKIILALIKDLEREGYRDVVVKQNRQLYIRRNKIKCDIYDAIEGRMDALNSYRGEYMIEYSWAEISESVQKIRSLKN